MSTAPSVGASLTTPRVPAGSVSEFDELDLLSEGIASIQSAQNDGGHYLVKLHGGTKVVRRSAAEVKMSAPRLLEQWLRDNSPARPPAASISVIVLSDSDSDDAPLQRRRNPARLQDRESDEAEELDPMEVDDSEEDESGAFVDESSEDELGDASSQSSESGSDDLLQRKSTRVGRPNSSTSRPTRRWKTASVEAESESSQSNEGSVDSESEAVESEEDQVEVLDVELPPLDQNSHRQTCKKCRQAPLSVLLPKFLAKQQRSGHKKKKKRATDDFEHDSRSEEAQLRSLGAWVECETCICGSHFGCLPAAAQNVLLRKFKAMHAEKHDGAISVPPRGKMELDMSKTLSVPKCPACQKGSGNACMLCRGVGRAPPLPEVANTDPGLLFRCAKCKRAAHYGCLPRASADVDTSFTSHALSYFNDTRCHECYNFASLEVDLILAWNGAESQEADMRRTSKLPTTKDPNCDATYLVKWKSLSYRRLEWVNHSFLVAVAPAKLTNFLNKGPTVALDATSENDIAEDGAAVEEEEGRAILMEPDAEERVPVAWRTVDRVLDVFYDVGRATLVPHHDYRKIPADPLESLAQVGECYIKWCGLPYNQSTTEEPPKPGDEGYEKFVEAYKLYLISCDPKMRVPILNAAQDAQLKKRRPKSYYVKIEESQVAFLENGRLKDFQLVGVNFLFYQWLGREGAILGDEMGLGKTLQVIALLAYLCFHRGARPFLVVVPNSTIGNWMNEFAKWTPTLRVVPYSGDAASRKIIEDYELFSPSGQQLKTQVVVTTYEVLANNVALFRRVTRWECLVVDEGQRIKGGDTGKLWSALAGLNINQRILLTGTPLNNNLGELYNLLEFINPREQISAEKREEEVTPKLIEEVRGLLKPYFLRRTKGQVLNLPPINVVSLEVSLTPIARQLYRGILTRNADTLRTVAQLGAKAATKIKPASFSNIFMELRKLLGHPFLVSPELDERTLSVADSHAALVSASSKLQLLSIMLPKLRATGSRVLIFSQFKIVLNVLEDFIEGSKLGPHLRLDGNTPQLQRQRDIDAFQAPNSPYFCYLLSTRAGGVGINLTSADTVIVYDPDWNPHQDLQAIARVHRIGQTKPVRVFKLVTKSTCEERIMRDGQRKLGLDHLIIQRIDSAKEVVADDVASILDYGAGVIFDDAKSFANEIKYSPSDVDDLLLRTLEPPPPVASDVDEGASTFAQGKVWEKIAGPSNAAAADDSATVDKHFWEQILAETGRLDKLSQAEKEANVGRGQRKRKAGNYDETNSLLDGFGDASSPHSALHDAQDDDFGPPMVSDVDSDEDEHDPAAMQIARNELFSPAPRIPKPPPLIPLVLNPLSGILEPAPPKPKKTRISKKKADEMRETRNSMCRKLLELAAPHNLPELEALLHRAIETANPVASARFLNQAVVMLQNAGTS